jgi:Domain of unknown function (DUF4157)
VADQVMRMADPTAMEKAAVSGQTQASHIRRMCSGCEEELHRQREIMTKGVSGQSCESAPSVSEDETEETPVMGKLLAGEVVGANHHLQESLSSTKGGGSPLPDQTRSFMESRFRFDFSAVRVHTDTNAGRMTRDLNAEAFTTGRDIYFEAGRYDPETKAGKKLLVHELTHVVQQRAGAGSIDCGEVENKMMIQRYSLKGFPAAEEAAMNAAVPAAISTVKSCSARNWLTRFRVSNALDNHRYDYKEDLGLCGWTFPGSWYIEVGKSAFDTQKCCDLPSTLAHEASHTVLFTESAARKLECDCFGCSC